jgi:phosphoenolpyruvate carboxylase
MQAWYGFAAGVRHGIERFGEAEVSSMFAKWPFARVLIHDIELSLAKADLDIAKQYSELAGRLHEHFYPLLRREFDESVALVLALTGQEKLLDGSDTLRRAIRLRNPYVDPMSYLQVDLLERWRNTGRQDDEVLKALLASINGIAHAMQNTG